MAESEDVSGQMAVIDTELQRKREADIREHYNTKAREFADKLLPKLESQIKVLVKVSPVRQGPPLDAEHLTFSLTAPKGVDVLGFKEMVALKLNCTASSFVLFSNERRLRDEELMVEALDINSGDNKTKKKMNWAGPYQGLVWIYPSN